MIFRAKPDHADHQHQPAYYHLKYMQMQVLAGLRHGGSFYEFVSEDGSTIWVAFERQDHQWLIHENCYVIKLQIDDITITEGSGRIIVIGDFVSCKAWNSTKGELLDITV